MRVFSFWKKKMKLHGAVRGDVFLKLYVFLLFCKQKYKRQATHLDARVVTPRRLCARVCQKLHAMKAVGSNKYLVQCAPFSDVVTMLALALCCDVACNEERIDLLSYVVP